MPSLNLVNDSAQPSRFSRRKVLKGTVETLTRKTREIMLFIGKPMGRSIMISNNKID